MNQTNLNNNQKQATMKTLKQELQEALDTIKTDPDNTPIDVLPILRKHLVDPDIMQYLEDTNDENFKNFWENPHINAIVVSKMENGQYFVRDSEPDQVYVSYHVYIPSSSPLGIKLETITDDIYNCLIYILMFDCTDYCNALEYVNLSQYGFFTTGDVSMTYHS